jgi:cell division transport system permease protein
MNLFYFIKEAFRGFYQAKLMTFVSVMTIGFALFFLGCMAVGIGNIRLWLKNASARVEAVVYVKDRAAADAAAFEDLVAKVRACDQVSGVTIVDKKEAWERFRELYGADMLEAVDNNPFPVSLELSLSEKAQSVSSTEALRRELEQIDGIEDIQLSQQWVTLLERFRVYFLAGTAVFACILVFALHFMISNTIKLTIYARRELVRNMHFVGATNSYIKTPFILEGMLQGIVGGTIGAVAVLLAKALLSHVPVVWGPWYWFVFSFLTIGALFGCIGSMSAVRRFLVS